MIAVRPAQLSAWLAQASAEAGNAQLPVVLDVREAWELQTASVKPDGFELLHLPMASIPARLAEIPRDRPVACLCHHGGRSAQVTHFLMNQGYTRVANVAGGIHAWSQEVDPGIPVY